jgi:hypothetical protein
MRRRGFIPALFALLLTASAWPAPASAGAHHRHVSASQLASLLGRQRSLTLSNVTITGFPVLTGRYHLVLRDAVVLRPMLLRGRFRVSTERVVFKSDLLAEIDGRDTLTMDHTTVEGAFAPISGQSSCDRCNLTLYGDHNTFNQAFTVHVPHNSVIHLIRTRFSFVSVDGDYAELSCFQCTFTKPVHVDASRVDSLRLDFSSVTRPLAIVRSDIDILEIEDTDFGSSVDLTGSRINIFDMPCVNGQVVYIAWSQFGKKWLQGMLGGEDLKSPTGRADVANAQHALSCWQADFTQIGSDNDALTAHHEAIKLQRKITPMWTWAWLSAWALELRDGYGTAPWRPVAISAGIIVLFALIYTLTNAFQQAGDTPPVAKSPLLLFALAYSLETFIPVFSVTGIKQWGWRIQSWVRWLEVAEAVLGAIFTLLSAYSITAHLL